MNAEIGAYSAAKRMGIFDQVTAHMPVRAARRDLAKVWLIAGLSGSGKTWVVDQLSELAEIVRYDDNHFTFPLRIRDALKMNRAVVCETGFRYKEVAREFSGVQVVVIDETADVVLSRLRQRGGGHRFDMDKFTGYRKSMVRFAQRSKFVGTSQQVLDYLRQQLATSAST